MEMRGLVPLLLSWLRLQSWKAGSGRRVDAEGGRSVMLQFFDVSLADRLRDL
jgi:hypothetical protein